MIELFSPPFRSIVVNRETVFDQPGPCPPLGLVGQAEAAPEALYIEHASVRASGRRSALKK